MKTNIEKHKATLCIRSTECSNMLIIGLLFVSYFHDFHYFYHCYLGTSRRIETIFYSRPIGHLFGCVIFIFRCVVCMCFYRLIITTKQTKNILLYKCMILWSSLSQPAVGYVYRIGIGRGHKRCYCGFVGPEIAFVHVWLRLLLLLLFQHREIQFPLIVRMWYEVYVYTQRHHPSTIPPSHDRLVHALKAFYYIYIVMIIIIITLQI